MQIQIMIGLIRDLGILIYSAASNDFLRGQRRPFCADFGPSLSACSLKLNIKSCLILLLHQGDLGMQVSFHSFFHSLHSPKMKYTNYQTLQLVSLC